MIGLLLVEAQGCIFGFQFDFQAVVEIVLDLGFFSVVARLSVRECTVIWQSYYPPLLA